MLIEFRPSSGPDLLATLRSMGHGDEVAIVDGNYPAQEHARRLVRADGHGLVPLLTAILQVMRWMTTRPPRSFARPCNNDPAQSGPIHREIDALCARLKPAYRVQPLKGDDLYPRVRAAHTIIATSEMALYANVILRKGVIRGRDEQPDGSAYRRPRVAGRSVPARHQSGRDAGAERTSGADRWCASTGRWQSRTSRDDRAFGADRPRSSCGRWSRTGFWRGANRSGGASASPRSRMSLAADGAFFLG